MFSGIAMVARIPTGTIGTQLRLLSQTTTLNTHSRVIVSYEFINENPTSAYNQHVVTAKNLANDTYVFTTVVIQSAEKVWSQATCFIVEPGDLRLEVDFSSSTAGDFAITEVSLDKGVCLQNETELTRGSSTGTPSFTIQLNSL